MSKTLADLLAEADALDAKATKGPWRWNVSLKSRSMVLEAAVRGFEIVMDFVRWGMGGARPRFLVRTEAGALLQEADTFAVKVPGREHHAAWYQTLEHPDAAFMARSRTLLPELAAAARAEVLTPEQRAFYEAARNFCMMRTEEWATRDWLKWGGDKMVFAYDAMLAAERKEPQ